MYCPKCGKKNPEDAGFCMHCGADLSEYKVEVSPKVEISPKISVSAKAEGGLALKWKKKPEGHVETLERGKLPIYREFVKLEGKAFCPLCGNYACLEKCVGDNYTIEGKNGDIFYLYYCSACGKYLCCESEVDVTDEPWVH